MLPEQNHTNLPEDTEVTRRVVARGFSLIEVLLSLTVLTATSLSVMGLAASSARMQRQSEARAAAMYLARMQIDDFGQISQSNRLIGTDNQIWQIDPELLEMMPKGTSNVSATWSVNRVLNSTNLQNIIVTIKWKNEVA
ncbi:MAG: type II secretion system protein, partial [Fimbriimonadales bacterium]|nr:type II secretion system protein [Fimbriimonadales bacterium]